MATVNSSTNDGYCQSGLGTFVDARNHAGASYDNNNVRDAAAINVFQTTRGGGSWGFKRVFMDFDTSSISSTVSSATLKIRGFHLSSADIIVVKSEHSTSLGAGDFNSFPSAAVTALGNSDGSGAGTFAGISGLTYSAEISTWSTSGYNDITLLEDARDDMESLSTFKICLMEYDYDYLDITTPNSSNLSIGLYWVDIEHPGLVPYIDYTVEGAAVTDNATFFGANF